MEFDPEYWGATTEEIFAWFDTPEELFKAASQVYATTLESCIKWWEENKDD